jgi:hypothetical protein
MDHRLASSPVHQIADQLADQIADGELGEGDRSFPPGLVTPVPAAPLALGALAGRIKAVDPA